MSQKPVLTYFEGRGRAELIRLTMSVAGVEWSDVYLKENSEFEKLKADGKLLFGQLPLLEIDGRHLVQTTAIVRYIARKGGLLGNNEDETSRIEVLFEGTRDFQAAYANYGFTGYDSVVQNAKNTGLKRYLPIFERVLKENGTGYLVGNRVTLADVGLLEPLLWTEELLVDELNAYPEVRKFLQNMKSSERISRYLNGPQRNRINDETYVAEVRKVLNWY